MNDSGRLRPGGTQPVRDAEHPPGILETIGRRCREQAGATAVEADDGTMTYAQLDAFSDRVARALRTRGIGRGDLVGVLSARDHRLPALLVGILRAGSAYVPMSVDDPPARRQTVMEKTRPAVVIGSGHEADGVDLSVEELLDTPIREEHSENGPEGGPDTPMCVLFTSGSTGTPKAVSLSRSGLDNLLRWTSSAFSPEERGRVLVSSALTFDFSVFEILPTLALGSTLVMARNPFDVHDDQHVTMVAAAPSILSALIDAGRVGPTVRVIVAGGEVLTRRLAERVLRLPHRPRLVNIYGPAECTVLCSAAEVEDADSEPSIGRPIPGAVMAVLDPDRRPLPMGSPGELWVGGKGLSLGYLNDPDRTRERFCELDLPGWERQTLYRTGDLARWEPDGDLYFLGRIDNQIKLRGVRIEPGEVESALATHPAVAMAAVFPVGLGGEAQLHAAVTVTSPAIGTGPLAAHLSSLLPRHMMPGRIHILDEMPRSAHGKLDRQRLAELALSGSADSAEAAPDADADAKTTPLENALLDLWREVLVAAPGLDLDTDFFSAGGDSLSAFRMATEAELKLGVYLPLAWLADQPLSVRRLAARLSQETSPGGEPPEDALVRVRSGGSDLAPLVLVFPGAANVFATRLLLDTLAPDRPVYAVSVNWAGAGSFSDVLDQVTREVAAVPAEMMHLAGYSIGGAVAYEVASRLKESGRAVGVVALLDAVAPALGRIRLRRRMRLALGIPDFWRRAAKTPEPSPDDAWEDQARSYLSNHRPTPFDGRVELLSTASTRAAHGPLLGWDRIHPGGLPCRDLTGDHLALLRAPHASEMGRVLEECLSSAEIHLPK